MLYSLKDTDLILASESTSRQRMLINAGLTIKSKPAYVDEENIKKSALIEEISFRDIATILAEMKAKKISLMDPQAFVIGADQLLVCDGYVFSKPKDRDEAEKNLTFLAGKTHQLVTAAVVFHNGQRLWHYGESPTVTIRSLSGSDIKDYLDIMGDAISYTPGVYMIENLGAQIISKINGCPYVVLGLPLLQLLAFLREHNLQLNKEKR